MVLGFVHMKKAYVGIQLWMSFIIVTCWCILMLDRWSCKVSTLTISSFWGVRVCLCVRKATVTSYPRADIMPWSKLPVILWWCGWNMVPNVQKVWLEDWQSIKMGHQSMLLCLLLDVKVSCWSWESWIYAVWLCCHKMQWFWLWMHDNPRNVLIW
jgi:hypothetical protein